MKLVHTLWHRYLRVPYTLHIHWRKRVKGAKRTLVFLHGVGSSGAAWKEVISELRDEPVNIIVLDMLGFGASPKPKWATYSAATQARSVAKTIAMTAMTRKITLVGHSMGALVAIECAKRYKGSVTSLILASPPLYDDKSSSYLPDRDEQLKKLYAFMTKHPKRIITASKIARKYGLIGREFAVDDHTIDEYIATLRMTIINQTSLQDIRELRIPITITYGTLDPFVIGARFKSLRKEMSNITVTPFIGAHEVEGRYVGIVAQAIRDRLLESHAQKEKPAQNSMSG